MTAALFLLAIPGAAQMFKHVPPEHLFGDHIGCPCGETHEAPELGGMKREDCGRWFVRTRNAVLAYREEEAA